MTRFALPELLTHIRDSIASREDEDAFLQSLDGLEDKDFPRAIKRVRSRAYANGKKSVSTTELTTRAESAEAEATRLKNAMTALEAAAPNSATLKAQYDQRETELKNAHKTELDGLRTRVTQSRIDSLVSDYRSEIGKVLLPVHADAATVAFRSRIATGTDGEPFVRAKDASGKLLDIALSQSDSDATPIQQAAKEEVARATPAMKLSTVVAGGGTGSGNGGAPAASNKYVDDLLKSREAVANPLTSGFHAGKLPSTGGPVHTTGNPLNTGGATRQ